jgi:hypothetical protein
MQLMCVDIPTVATCQLFQKPSLNSGIIWTSRTWHESIDKDKVIQWIDGSFERLQNGFNYLCWTTPGEQSNIIVQFANLGVERRRACSPRRPNNTSPLNTQAKHW